MTAWPHGTELLCHGTNFSPSFPKYLQSWLVRAILLNFFFFFILQFDIPLPVCLCRVQLIIAVAGVLVGYDGSFDFKEPGTQYGETPYIGMRCVRGN